MCAIVLNMFLNRHTFKERLLQLLNLLLCSLKATSFKRLFRCQWSYFLIFHKNCELRCLRFCIKSTFWLTPMSFLNGFEEDMKTNYNSILGSKPTTYNMDSNAMLSNIRDLVRGSEAVVNGGILPIAFL
jgi:hypothetical protein